jgi:aspartate carbamoyltransferase regulatory subunit
MYYLYYLEQNGIIQYVGLTKNINARKSQHKKTKPTHNFFVIEEIKNVKEASQKEREHIEKNNTYFNGWNKSPGGEYLMCSGYTRKNIGGVKKGTVPWNKGKNGYKIHSELTLQKLSKNNTGENNPKAKLTEKDVIDIINTYRQKPHMDHVGNIMPNGRPMSYDRSFSWNLSKKYSITPENITRIIKKKSWLNIWNKLKDDDVC